MSGNPNQEPPEDGKLTLTGPGFLITERVPAPSGERADPLEASLPSSEAAGSHMRLLAGLYCPPLPPPTTKRGIREGSPRPLHHAGVIGAARYF